MQGVEKFFDAVYLVVHEEENFSRTKQLSQIIYLYNQNSLASDKSREFWHIFVLFFNKKLKTKLGHPLL